MFVAVRKLGEFVLRGHFQAAAAALVFSVLPILSTISLVILSFVTLRKGATRGLPVLLVILAINLGLDIKTVDFAFFFAVGLAVTVWLFSASLHQSASWSKTLQYAGLLGSICICAFYLVYPEPVQFWGNFYQSLLALSSKAVTDKATIASMAKVFQVLIPISTGYWVAIILLFAVIKVFLARWWQASLFNPAGLGNELRAIRISPWYGLLAVSSALIAATGWTFMWNVALALALPLILAGISLVHTCLERLKYSYIAVLIFYIMLIIGSYIWLLIMAAVALVDSVFDFRKRL